MAFHPMVDESEHKQGSKQVLPMERERAVAKTAPPCFALHSPKRDTPMETSTEVAETPKWMGRKRRNLCDRDRHALTEKTISITQNITLKKNSLEVSIWGI
jgi:hypothetical protein